MLKASINTDNRGRFFFQAIQFTHVLSMLGFTWKDHNPLQLEKAFPLPLDFLQRNFALLDKEVVIIGHYI